MPEVQLLKEEKKKFNIPPCFEIPIERLAIQKLVTAATLQELAWVRV